MKILISSSIHLRFLSQGKKKLLKKVVEGLQKAEEEKKNLSLKLQKGTQYWNCTLSKVNRSCKTKTKIFESLVSDSVFCRLLRCAFYTDCEKEAPEYLVDSQMIRVERRKPGVGTADHFYYTVINITPRTEVNQKMLNSFYLMIMIVMNTIPIIFWKGIWSCPKPWWGKREMFLLPGV